MKKLNKLGVVLLASGLLLTACAKSGNSSNSSSTSSKLTASEQKQLKQATSDYKTFIEGEIDQLLKEKIFELFKPLIEKKDAKLVKTLETEFKNVNGLLDKHMIDDKNYKSYTDLSEADTKELAEAVTKLGEPLSQMGVILDGK